MASPRTHYAKSGNAHIAYQVVGDGPIDIVYVPGWVSHVELCWEDPSYAQFLGKLASFARLILFDKRGTGLSDRVPNDSLPTLEERADDLLAVMNAANVEKAAIFGFSEGGNLSAYFAASHPDRTAALIMFGTFAKRIWSPDYPWAPTPEQREKTYVEVENEWGNLMDLAHYAPSKVHDHAFAERIATYFRRSASPGAAVTLLKMNTQIDITRVLPAVHVPSLVLHRVGDRDAKVEEGRWIADRIPNAKFVELAGDDHLPWVGDQDAIVNPIKEFLTGSPQILDVERVLATVLFTDIVGSTALAQEMGDKSWRTLLDEHDNICRKVIGEFAGRLVKNTGDGALASFAGPGRAIQCAHKIMEECADIGLPIRTGLHTGECEIRGDDISGLAVHLAARVASIAEANELVVSRTVRDLVAGSGFQFEGRGEHQLKGFSEKWSLYSVSSAKPNGAVERTGD